LAYTYKSLARDEAEKKARGQERKFADRNELNIILIYECMRMLRIANKFS